MSDTIIAKESQPIEEKKSKSIQNLVILSCFSYYQSAKLKFKMVLGESKTLRNGSLAIMWRKHFSISLDCFENVFPGK